jgi:hypothetical protein
MLGVPTNQIDGSFDASNEQKIQFNTEHLDENFIPEASTSNEQTPNASARIK